mgnify:CR=1 FL=1
MIPAAFDYVRAGSADEALIRAGCPAQVVTLDPHTLDDVLQGATDVADAAGPNQFGITGRAPASRTGFADSSSMRQLREPWSRTSLDRFLSDPQVMVPGTYMAFTGVKRGADRQSLICYLEVQADR